MGIPLLFFFFFLFMRLMSAEINGDQSQYDECKATRCSHHGPVIRFPFWLKDQAVPNQCGYPGFELSCSEEKRRTILDLQHYSVKFWVKKINYTSQEIIVRLADYCPQKQIPDVYLSASPFQYFTESYPMKDLTIFKCSENKQDSHQYPNLWPIPCSFHSSDPVYAISSSASLIEENLTSCRKIFNATLPQFLLTREDTFSMTWSNPICGNCEAQGYKCQRKKISNSTEPQIECIPRPPKGMLLHPYHLLESLPPIYALSIQMKYLIVFLMYALFVPIKLD